MDTTTVTAPRDHHRLLRRWLTGQRGEGVVSTGIAVLIMAIIGAGMWVAFNSSWGRIESEVDNRTTCIVDRVADCD